MEYANKNTKNEQKYRDARLNWCARHKNQSWEKIIFTDEWTFYLEAPKGHKWLKIGESYFSETQKYSKKKINCWGAISAKGKAQIYIFEKYELRSICWYFNWKIEWFQRIEQWRNKTAVW